MFQRRSIRLQTFNYSTPGYYYVTICTKEKENVFGSINNGKMILNHLGSIINETWLNIPQTYPNIKLDKYIIMPDHIHGIIRIVVRAGFPRPVVRDAEYEKGEGTSPLRRTGGVPPPHERRTDIPPPHARPITLGHIVAYFKYQTTKQINQLRDTPGNPVWQRNHYEHIIRDEMDLERIREYIQLNPERWDTKCRGNS